MYAIIQILLAFSNFLQFNHLQYITSYLTLWHMYVIKHFREWKWIFDYFMLL